MRAWYWWGLAGLALLLVRALHAIAPEASRFLSSARSMPEWGLVVGVVLAMTWAEGFRGFQRGLVPRLIERAHAIATGGTTADRILAPLVALELLRSSPRRVARRWALVVVIALLMAATREMGDPWRGALLCGVLAGLGWGLAALLAQAWRGAPRPVAQTQDGRAVRGD